MKKLVVIAGAAALSACGSPEAEQPEAPVVETEAVTEAAPLYETTWTFAMDGKDYIESIDANGGYVANQGEEHNDHGTYALVDGKHCFTSAMTEEGQVCWTTPATIEVGDTVDATSDGGDTLTITREEYQPLAM